MTRKSLLAFVCALLLAGAGGAWAQVANVRTGEDSWRTPPGGTTFFNFGSAPLPAGFFGPGSQPFTGVVNFQGQPLFTAPAGALGQADTLVRRLAGTVVPLGGNATVPITLIALDLVSQAPITVTFASGSLT